MEKRITVYENKLVVSVIFRYVFGLIIFISMFLAIGIAGSLECDMITIKQFIIRELITITITCASAFILNVIEIRIEHLSNYLNKLYHKQELMKKKNNKKVIITK